MTPEELFNSNEFALEILNYCRTSKEGQEDLFLKTLSKKFGDKLMSHLTIDYCYDKFLNKFDHEYDYIDSNIKVLPCETIQDQFMIYAVNQNVSYIINNISLLAASCKETYYYFEKFADNGYIVWLSYIEPTDQEFYFKSNPNEGFLFNRIDNVTNEEDRQDQQTGLRFMIPIKLIDAKQVIYAGILCNKGVACRELNKENLYVNTELMERFNSFIKNPCDRFFQFGTIINGQEVKDLLSMLGNKDYTIKLVNK